MKIENLKDLAAEWIRTDRAAALDDVRRLGFRTATYKQLLLVAECVRSGDARWKKLNSGPGFGAMQDELAKLTSEG